MLGTYIFEIEDMLNDGINKIKTIGCYAVNIHHYRPCTTHAKSSSIGRIP